MCTKAVVQDMYGSAEVMQLRDIDKPEIGTTCWFTFGPLASIRPTWRS